MSKKGEYDRFKNYEKKIISPFIIYGDFQSNLGSEDNVKKNPDTSYTNKYRKQVPCSYGYKLACFDGKLVSLFSHT